MPRPILLLPVLLATLAAPAAAQVEPLAELLPTSRTTVELLIQPPEAPLPVDGGHVALPVEVQYTYTTLPGSFQSTAVELRVTDLPPWLVATVSPSTVYMPVSPLVLGPMQATQHAQAMLLLAPTADAPAFQEGTVELLAFAHANGPYMASETRNAIGVQADFYALTELTAPAHVGLRQGEEALVPLLVANFGNAPVRVRFALDHAPEGLEVTVPSSIVLGSKQAGDERTRAVANLRIGAEARYAEGDVVVRALASFARDPKLVGDSAAVEIHVSEEGSREGVQVHSLGASPAGPAWVETGLAFAALASVGLYARTRRRP